MCSPVRYQPYSYSSPWALTYRIRLLLWLSAWTVFCQWTPKPFNFFRIFVLRLFGAKISYGAFVHQRARIAHPWNLLMEEGSCLGDGAHAYSLASISIHRGATVAQECYLCTGTHDFSLPSRPLLIAPITIKAHAFIGARAFLLPGVVIGQCSIIGACSVVTKSILPHQTVAGNPAKIINPLPL